MGFVFGFCYTNRGNEGDVNRVTWLVDTRVSHVTDTVDYTTLQVPEWPLPEERAIFVYPNPANGKVTIEGVEADEVWVYNAFGQVVKRVRNSNEISVEGLSEGVYLVRIVDSEGKIFMEKVMVR